MEYKSRLDSLFEYAEKNGVSKGAIGIEVFGRKAYSRIYTLKNPTDKTYQRVFEAVYRIIDIKRKNKSKK